MFAIMPRSPQMQTLTSYNLKTKGVDEKKLFFFLKNAFKRHDCLDQ
jgi:hypothetical protein